MFLTKTITTNEALSYLFSLLLGKGHVILLTAALIPEKIYNCAFNSLLCVFCFVFVVGHFTYNMQHLLCLIVQSYQFTLEDGKAPK